MRKKYYLLLLGLAAALTLSACGSSDGSDDSSDSDSAVTETETAAEDTEATEEDTEEETEASSLASITPSDYLVENVSDYITVGDLEGLEVTQYTYEVTDDTVQEEIDYMLEDYEEEVEVDRAAQSGDTVYVQLTSTVEDADVSYIEDTYFYIGDADYGEEFDEALIGASAGDTVTFSISYSEEDGDELLIDEEWIGETVDFEAEIESVCETTEVDYTDEFIAENSDYSTIEEFEAAMEEYLVDQYEEQSYSDMLEDLIAEALDNCEITGIPDDLYETCYDETVSDYGYFLDTDDVDEILEAYDMTEDELDEEVQDLAARRLLISYICEENDIEVTEEEYVAYVEQYAEYYGYDTAEEYEDDMTRSYLVWSLYEAEAGAILYESAEVTVETYDDSWLDEDEDYLEEESDTEEEIFDADAEEEAETDEEIFDADAEEEGETGEEIFDADAEEAETDEEISDTDAEEE
ncbi:MAG: hypothetical protein LUG99_17920 [Lachnospiraceae bacterium]|nr:hypothetical protein [Lachnospiraceae bacterium]